MVSPCGSGTGQGRGTRSNGTSRAVGTRKLSCCTIVRYHTDDYQTVDFLTVGFRTLGISPGTRRLGGFAGVRSWLCRALQFRLLAGPGPGDDFESCRGDCRAGPFADAEVVGVVVEPLQGSGYLGEGSGFPVGHDGVEFLLHGVGALVGHMEGHLGDVAGLFLLVLFFMLFGVAAEEFGNLLALLEEAALDGVALVSGHVDHTCKGRARRPTLWRIEAGRSCCRLRMTGEEAPAFSVNARVCCEEIPHDVGGDDVGVISSGECVPGDVVTGPAVGSVYDRVEGHGGTLCARGVVINDDISLVRDGPGCRCGWAVVGGQPERNGVFDRDDIVGTVGLCAAVIWNIGVSKSMKMND